jgi:hypothetical protein
MTFTRNSLECPSQRLSSGSAATTLSNREPGTVAYISNSSYAGGRDWEGISV